MRISLARGDDLNSKKRKNCIVVLNIILESLLKWFTPILVFTSEEIFSLISKDDKKSVHESLFAKIPKSWNNQTLSKKWAELFRIKQEVNVAIEEKRARKVIGSSLEAEIKLTLSREKYELLDNLDLAEYFITSKAERALSNGVEFKIEVNKAKGNKCQRCWKILKKGCSREDCPII